MVDKQVRGKYTLEYKLEAVRQVKAGQSGAVVAKVGLAARAADIEPNPIKSTITMWDGCPGGGGLTAGKDRQSLWDHFLQSSC